MNDIKTISQEEITELLKEFPKLQQFNSQMRTIALLKDDDREEKDPILLIDSYETILRLQERLYAKIVVYYIAEHTKQFNATKDIAAESQNQCRQLIDKLQEEQQAHNEVFDKMCFLMVVNPRGTFEDVILRNIERQKKIEDASGQSWQWCLHFSLYSPNQNGIQVSIWTEGHSRWQLMHWVVWL